VVAEPADETAPAADIDAALPESAPDAAADLAVESEMRVAEPLRTARAGIADRHAALDLIREARHWFEQHEPSSPIPVLLRRAEQFVGKRYSEVVKAISPEMLAQWESDNSVY
jgi:type VI secretion system protein ImpA